MMLLDETTVFHLVKPPDLNHHDTLFAGRMAEWLVEACFIAAARLVGRPDDVHCVQVHDMSFRRALKAGDIVDIRARVAHLARQSITVYGEATTRGHPDTAVTILVTFLTVDNAGKPYEHHFSLPPEYVATHAELCRRARGVVAKAVRGRRRATR
jgi:acyl-CoA hydrolase